MDILDRHLERFIEMERLVRSKDSAQWQIWQLIKDSFMKRKSIAYWRFPLYILQGEQRQLSDILIVDQQQGLIILNINDTTLDAIDIVAAQKKMARHIESVQSLLAHDVQLAMRVQVKGLIVLPKVSTSEWSLANSNVILKEDLTQHRLLRKIERASATVTTDALSIEAFQSIQGVLSGIHMEPIALSKATSERLNVIKHLSQQLKVIDMKQHMLGKVIAPGQQRIRGISGTGKTAVQCQKAAHMHLKYPDWHIGLVYDLEDHTSSLIAQIDYWLRYFSNNTVQFEQAKSHIHVHSFFGGATEAGFFATVCRAHQYEMPDMVAFQHRYQIHKRSDLIGALCKRFLEEVEDVQPFYDALLIDDGECFMTKEVFQFEDRQPFYWLSYQLTKPLAGEKVNRRLVWAYDESANLSNIFTPTARAMFGSEPAFRHFVTGMHKGGLLKSDLMLTCYRTPAPIITAAHTIGMGLLRQEGMLAGATTKEAWQLLGYDVKGVFQEGERIVLYRPPAHSPNQLAKIAPTSLMELQIYQGREKELDELAAALKANRDIERLDMTRHILILTLGEDKVLQQHIANGLSERGVRTHIPHEKNCFYKDGAVTVSTVSHAKGQEAFVLYVVGLEKLAAEEGHIALRNELFNAFMHTRGWCYLSGLGEGAFYKELKEAIRTGNTISFTFKKSS